MLTAGEFCKRDVVVALAHEPVAAVAQRMRERRVGSVIVVDEQPAGRIPIGVLTDREIVAGLVALKPSHVDRALVRDLPLGKHATAHEEEDLYEVSLRMRSHSVQRVTVVNRAGALQGIVAFDDLLLHVAAEIGRLAERLERLQENERGLRVSSSPESSRERDLPGVGARGTEEKR